MRRCTSDPCGRKTEDLAFVDDGLEAMRAR